MASLKFQPGDRGWSPDALSVALSLACSFDVAVELRSTNDGVGASARKGDTVFDVAMQFDQFPYGGLDRHTADEMRAIECLERINREIFAHKQNAGEVKP